MSKKKAEINVISAEHLKIAIREIKSTNKDCSTQSDIADKLGIAPETLSRIANGTAPLLPETAKWISTCFPGYRTEWLLGQDKYKTPTDAVLGAVNGTEPIKICTPYQYSYWSGSESVSLTFPNGQRIEISVATFHAAETEIHHFIEFTFEKLKEDVAHD